LLLRSGLGIEDNDLGSGREISAHRDPPIDVETCSTLFVTVPDFRREGAVVAAEARLDRILAARGKQTSRRYTGVLTDGAEWRLYLRLDDGLRPVTAPFTVDPRAPDTQGLVGWLEAVMASQRRITPGPREIGACQSF
jgi:hypothetical protein